MLSKDITIVVNTCDAYCDVLEIFFLAFKENWPDCPYQIVINTEIAKYDYPAQTHNYISENGEDHWGARLLATLSTVETEFVLMLYDDYILESPVNIELLTTALQSMKNDPNAAVAYLIDTTLELETSGGNTHFTPIKQKANFRLNSAPGIWRKQVLLDYTEPGDTPWAWEVFGSYRTWGDGRYFYSLNPIHDPIFDYNYSKGGAIYRGKWVRAVIDNVIEKYPVSIDWNIRGYSSVSGYEKRSLAWKLNFLLTGFRMVGFKALYFIFGYIWDRTIER